MAERGISLESIMQHSPSEKDGLPLRRPMAKRVEKAKPAAAVAVGVILITHATSEHLVREALDAILADGTIDSPAQVIRIERE